ncbi:MAG: acetyltransferase, partial [Alphaproteobacteria bacterium]
GSRHQFGNFGTPLTQPSPPEEGGRGLCGSALNQFPERIVMWGAGDQGRVNQPIIDALGGRLFAAIDDTPGLASPFPGVEVFEGYERFRAWLGPADRSAIGFIIAIGNPYGHVRVRLHDMMAAEGFQPVSFADPSAVISADAVLGPGAQIMPGAVIQTRVRLGTQCLINTSASVDHDCVLEDGVEIAPGAVLCGRVHVGRHAWVCAGATLISRVRIGTGAIVAAGATVIRDVPDHVMVAGVPARWKKDLEKAGG